MIVFSFVSFMRKQICEKVASEFFETGKKETYALTLFRHLVRDDCVIWKWKRSIVVWQFSFPFPSGRNLEAMHPFGQSTFFAYFPIGLIDEVVAVEKK